MSTGEQVTFRTAQAIEVPPGKLTKLPLAEEAPSPHVHYDDERGIVFDTRGWHEVLMRVDWAPDETAGTRFSHTKIPDNEPLHSEAINAEVLARISDGRQLLRGNTIFGLDHTSSIVLEVWHDVPHPVAVQYAQLVVRQLEVPL